MIDPVGYVLASAGTVIGVAMGWWFGPSSKGASIVLTLTAASMVGLMLSAPVGAALSAGVVVGLGAAMTWWRVRNRSVQRATGMFDDPTRRSIVAHEMAAAGWWGLAALALASALFALSMADSAARWFVLLPVVGAVGVGLLSRRTGERDRPFDVDVVEGDIELVIVGTVEDVPAAGDEIIRRRRHVAVVPSPPVLFRGLVGWNLGLGLDAERAAWAGTMARGIGLGPALCEPEWVLDHDQAIQVALCRALASRSDVVVMELDSERVSKALARRLAGLVADARADRPVIVVCQDRDFGLRMAARVRSPS